jgi:hypothetical protein
MPYILFYKNRWFGPCCNERKRIVDLETKLKKIVKDTGKVNSVYGGFEILIAKPALFPWYRVFNLLTDIDQEVWINKREGKICITTEPRV